MAALLAVVVVSGCGDDQESTAKNEPKFAAASEPVDAFITRMAKLLETSSVKKDCLQLNEINARSTTRFPCPPAKKLRKSMARFEIVGAEEYGTGAVVDYKSGKLEDGATIVLFVSPDRNWGISRFGVITKPSTRTSDDKSRVGSRRIATRYLKAVRESDCKTYKDVAFTGDVGEDTDCKISFGRLVSLAKRLKANRSAKLKYEGGNGTYGFYSLETQKPRPKNSTISVVKSTDASGPAYVVMDVVPSPTAAEQRRVVAGYRRQQKNKANPGMEPSSKPSDPAVTTP